MSAVPKTLDTRAIEQELRITVATAGAILYHLGLADYMGHVSARVPGTERIVIKPRHSNAVHGMGTVSPERMVVIDFDGKLVEGNEGAPAEKWIHTEIYRKRPDVGGVIHTSSAAPAKLVSRRFIRIARSLSALPRRALTS